MKPLKDWTLAEVKAYCENRKTCAADCPFWSGDDCKLAYDGMPTEWRLEDVMSEQKKPRLAEILGVEVGKAFWVKIGGVVYGQFVIDGGGDILTLNDAYTPVDTLQALLIAIELPGRIIRSELEADQCV